MKILVIKSITDDLPMAEIRTDGRVIEYIVDNTHGELPEETGNSYGKLMRLLHLSSYLRAEEPKELGGLSLLRYVMNNGDSVEMTTDGKTALVNGKLLSQPEKQALFDAVRSGKLQVSRKADITNPIPILPITPKTKAVGATNSDWNKQLQSEMDKIESKREKLKRLSTKSYDHEIEQMDLRAAEDPEWAKKLIYWLKYGDKE